MTTPTPVQTVSYQDFLDYEDAVQQQFDAVNARISGLVTQTHPDQSLHLWGTANPAAFKGIPTNARRLYAGFDTNPAVLKAQASADAARGAWSYISIGAGNPNAKVLPQYSSSAMTPFIPALQANPHTVFLGIHEPGSGQHQYAPKDYVQWMADAFHDTRTRVLGLRTGVCLMEWTGRNSPNDFAQWLPDETLFDEFCIDGYSHTSGDTAPKLYANALTFAQKIQRVLTICEHGQDAKLGTQSQWLQSVFEFIKSSPWVKGAMYWNGTGPNGAYGLTPSSLKYFGALATDPALNPVALPL